MAQYTLTTYWWLGEQRQKGDDYPFDASDSSAAVNDAHSLFEEPLAMADQSEITDEHGSVVWQNEWPIR